MKINPEEQGRRAAGSPPGMSVILPLAGDFRSLDPLLRHLETQSNAHQLELIFVAWNRSLVNFTENLLGSFHSYKLVQMHGNHSRGTIYAEGVRAASAPVVALSENHAFPQPGWSAALMKAHEKAWAAVGPVIIPGKRRNRIDLACSFSLYAPWLLREKGEEMDDLPGSNSSYKRNILLQYGDELDRLLDNHTLLHWDLHRRKYGLWLEPAAKVYHHEYDDTANLLSENLRVGHRFAANRSVGWGAAKRLLYIMGSPLIPLVRLSRILMSLSGSTLGPAQIAKAAPLTLAALAAGAWGEIYGYLAGHGDIEDRQVAYELRLEKRMIGKGVPRS